MNGRSCVSNIQYNKHAAHLKTYLVPHFQHVPGYLSSHCPRTALPWGWTPIAHASNDRTDCSSCFEINNNRDWMKVIIKRIRGDERRMEGTSSQVRKGTSRAFSSSVCSPRQQALEVGIIHASSAEIQVEGSGSILCVRSYILLRAAKNDRLSAKCALNRLL
jgi:hypothetical protein